IGIDQRLEGQPQTVARRRQPERRGHGHLLAVSGLRFAYRGLAPRAPTPPQRGHEQAAFVQKPQRSMPPARFPLDAWPVDREPMRHGTIAALTGPAPWLLGTEPALPKPHTEVVRMKRNIPFLLDQLSQPSARPQFGGEA